MSGFGEGVIHDGDAFFATIQTAGPRDTRRGPVFAMGYSIVLEDSITKVTATLWNSLENGSTVPLKSLAFNAMEQAYGKPIDPKVDKFDDVCAQIIGKPAIVVVRSGGNGYYNVKTSMTIDAVEKQGISIKNPKGMSVYMSASDTNVAGLDSFSDGVNRPGHLAGAGDKAIGSDTDATDKINSPQVIDDFFIEGRNLADRGNDSNVAGKSGKR